MFGINRAQSPCAVGVASIPISMVLPRSCGHDSVFHQYSIIIINYTCQRDACFNLIFNHVRSLANIEQNSLSEINF